MFVSSSAVEELLQKDMPRDKRRNSDTAEHSQPSTQKRRKRHCSPKPVEARTGSQPSRGKASTPTAGGTSQKPGNTDSDGKGQKKAGLPEDVQEECQLMLDDIVDDEEIVVVTTKATADWTPPAEVYREEVNFVRKGDKGKSSSLTVIVPPPMEELDNLEFGYETDDPNVSNYWKQLKLMWFRITK